MPLLRLDLRPNRQSGGFYLEQAHLNPPQTSYEATTRWSSFGHKQAVLTMLLDEQYQLCCYSELRADQKGLGYHVEHIENKSHIFRRENSRLCDHKTVFRKLFQ